MTDPMLTPKSNLRSEVISSACLSFASGTILTMAMYYIAKGDPLAWLFVGCAGVMAASAFVVVRRTLRKLP